MVTTLTGNFKRLTTNSSWKHPEILPGYCFALPLDSKHKLLGQLPMKELEGTERFN